MLVVSDSRPAYEGRYQADEHTWVNDQFNYEVPSGEWNEGLFKKDYLFESDMKVPPRTILKYYNFETIPQGWNLYNHYVAAAEAAEAEKYSQFQRDNGFRVGAKTVYDKYINIWSDRTVPYKISPDLPQAKHGLIERAMKHWERHTCLKFVPAG